MKTTGLVKEYEPAKFISESTLQASVNSFFRKAGAEYVYHTHTSRFSEASFPDTFVIYHSRVIVIECKKENGKFSPTRTSKKTGRLLLGQLDVLDLIRRTGKIEVYTIKPSEYQDGKLERILDGTEPQADIQALRQFEGKSNLPKVILEGLLVPGFSPRAKYR